MPRSLTLILAPLWLALSLAAGAFLITRSYSATTNAHLVSQASTLAGLITDQLQNHVPAATNPSLADPDTALLGDLSAAARLDPSVAYIMLWSEDGQILAHTRPHNQPYLDVNKWPALDPQQPSRISHLSVPEWSAAPDPRVLEATVPITFRNKTLAYLSLARYESAIAAQFWPTQGPLVLAAFAFSLIGLALLLAAGAYASARFERSRREILQTARARTSLLTERGMLASVLAHEIRSPLTALRFNLHALRQLLTTNIADQSDKQTQLTDRCEREIRRLDNMLTDFLHHTQVIGNTTAESTSLNSAILEATEFLRPTLERSRIHVSLHLDPADPRVHVHPDELRQVILNLTANAQDALQNLPAQKPRTLAISTIADTPSDPSDPAATPTVTLLIRDSGPGIPPDIRERIFEPFFSTKPNGSGLGLTLVRRVISGAGGTILYESSPEQNTPGTTFRITLPRAHPSEPSGSHSL
ncbi:MAG TPA: HAMP domain-containing sensor histidine kinase [Phycisphaerae bacterium]|nr:HAMP domain-containing sensor histidine kinase [Phycisphaerae bacterium]